MEKQCSKCKEDKNIALFHRNRANKDGLSWYCKECRGVYDLKRRAGQVVSFEQKMRKRVNARERWRRPQVRKQRIIRQRLKRQASVMYRFEENLSESIRVSLHSNKNGRKWEDVVGYNLESLKSHIGKQFREDMSWGNYGKWHIDHIIPKSFFQYSSSDDVEFKMCWRLENLQPLWAKENIMKGNRIKKSA